MEATAASGLSDRKGIFEVIDGGLNKSRVVTEKQEEMIVQPVTPRRHEGIDMRAVYAGKKLLYKAIKRAFDIVVSGLALLVLAPLFLVTAIAVKLEDGGPVFFSGERYGKDLYFFRMHKFRSMVPDAEARLRYVLREEEKNGLAFKIKNDPRVTRVGRFIRRTSIDELPQLWNVFKGEMSIVGPRPIATTDRKEDPYDMQRWIVKPGLTCYWQVSGRANISWDEWVEMDLDYIQNMGIWEDLKLIFLTFPALIRRDGAF